MKLTSKGKKECIQPKISFFAVRLQLFSSRIIFFPLT